MATTVPAGGPAAEDLLLRVTPPRVPRHLVVRGRLLISDERWADAPVVLVRAPAGFGKTSLLAQWRREHLAQGAVVAWLSAHGDAQRLLHSLVLAVRLGAGRPAFGHTLLDSAAGSAATGLEGITAWLAELAQAALNTVLIVDEAERLPEPAREALAYLVRNAPPNLRVVIAARPDCVLGIDDLVTYGQCVAIGATTLRFQLDETLSLVHTRFGTRVDADSAARLHELTEGWPLGLQLALSIIGAGNDPRMALQAIETPSGELRSHLVGLLLARLDPADSAFLTRIAVLDPLHPDLCVATTGQPDAALRLARLARDTPVFAAAEQGDWLRMHSLAREQLQLLVAALPADERAGLHARAAVWLAAQGQMEAAAGHALTAGQHDLAYELAERSLYESLMAQGRQGTVLDWLVRLPEAELDRRPRLLLVAAWSLALSERHDEAGRLVARILAQPIVDDALRCECALILSGAAVYADDPDGFAELHDRWATAPPLHDPLLLQVHANRSAFRSLIEGEPELARLRPHLASAGGLDDGNGRSGRSGHSGHSGQTGAYLGRWSDFIVGLSHLWQGQVLLAEQVLQPTLARAEADLGRRSPFACMLAALLAAAVWERQRPADAAALLAHRLDVLERSGLPEAVLLGYRTMARIAMAEGAENRALELLGALHAVGVRRRLPRLCIASLVDQVRMHARRFRPETCRMLCEQIDALLADPAQPQGRRWRRSVEVLRELALGHAALAAQEWRRALEPLARAEALARALKLGRLRIEALGLRALALDRCGERAQDLLREAVGLATAFGLLRVFSDAHPQLGDWVRQLERDAGAPHSASAGPLVAPIGLPPVRSGTMPRATPSLALTPKEREVLELAARNLSNKEIGLAMQVGEETIKWHMKNLFAKLDAGTRKQVVQRARILGLLDTG